MYTFVLNTFKDLDTVRKDYVEYIRNNITHVSECGYSQKSTLIAFACLYLKRSCE